MNTKSSIKGSRSAVMLAAALLPFILPARVRAYSLEVHEAVVQEAARTLCKAAPGSASCLEFSRYEKYAAFGARMEDAFKQGRSYVLDGTAFNDEDEESSYCSLRGTAGGYPYCTHYWFDNGGAAGSTLLGATNPDADAVISLVRPTRQWDSAWGRTVKIWNGKVLPYYAGGNYPMAYYWLGRAAHLLADTGVPQHVIPHGAVSMTELKHRCYELRVMMKYPDFAPARDVREPAPAPSDPYTLFSDLRSASREAAGYSPSVKEASETLTPERLKLFDELAASAEEDGEGRKAFFPPILDRACGAVFGEALNREASVLVPQIIERTAFFFEYFYSQAPFLPGELTGSAQAAIRQGEAVPE